MGWQGMQLEHFFTHMGGVDPTEDNILWPKRCRLRTPWRVIRVPPLVTYNGKFMSNLSLDLYQKSKLVYKFIKVVIGLAYWEHHTNTYVTHNDVRHLLYHELHYQFQELIMTVTNLNQFLYKKAPSYLVVVTQDLNILILSWSFFINIVCGDDFHQILKRRVYNSI